MPVVTETAFRVLADIIRLKLVPELNDRAFATHGIQGFRKRDFVSGERPRFAEDDVPRDGAGSRRRELCSFRTSSALKGISAPQ